MKVVLPILMLLTSLSVHAEVWVYRDKGDFQFESGPIQNEVRGLKSTAISFGEKLVVDLDFRLVNREGGQQTISGGHRLKNTDEKVLYYVFYIVFFDENMQIVAIDRSGNVPSLGGIKANDTWRFNSASDLPTNTYTQIRNYEAVLYVSDEIFHK